MGWCRFPAMPAPDPFLVVAGLGCCVVAAACIVLHWKSPATRTRLVEPKWPLWLVLPCCRLSVIRQPLRVVLLPRVSSIPGPWGARWLQQPVQHVPVVVPALQRCRRRRGRRGSGGGGRRAPYALCRWRDGVWGRRGEWQSERLGRRAICRRCSPQIRTLFGIPPCSATACFVPDARRGH